MVDESCNFFELKKQYAPKRKFCDLVFVDKIFIPLALGLNPVMDI